jgi:hypothetical protein
MDDDDTQTDLGNMLAILLAQARYRYRIERRNFRALRSGPDLGGVFFHLTSIRIVTVRTLHPHARDESSRRPRLDPRSKTRRL